MYSKKYVVETLLNNSTLRDLDRAYEYLQTSTDFNNSNKSNILVDYFTLEERLNTIGIKGICFYDFLENIYKYMDMPSIARQFTFCDINNRYVGNPIKRAKYVFNLYFGAINIMKPTRIVELIRYYPNCKTILNPFSGWGGTLIASSVKNRNYIGIDTNINLKIPYEKMIDYVKEKGSTSTINMYWENAVDFDYASIKYDMVITSPPYYNIEIYSNQPKYTSKTEWNELFYKPIFYNIFENLQDNGVLCINSCEDAYLAISTVLGPAHFKFPFKKYNRNNNYKEYFYIWKKLNI
jgi:hypothetical protein